MSENSFPASAQFSFLMSVKMICTASGACKPSAAGAFGQLLRQLAALLKVRPSNSWTLIIGIVFSLCQLLWSMGDAARLRGDPRRRGVDVREAVQIEPAFARKAGVAIERDVGKPNRRSTKNG